MTKSASATICYVEIPSPNIESAGEFYHSVFGWRITPSSLSEITYWEFDTGNDQLTGGLDSSLAVNDGGVILYLKVECISDTLKEIVKAGGSVIRERFKIGGGFGFSGVFKDPNGNKLGLFSSK